MGRIPLIIAGTDCLSGVTTWASQLRRDLADHPRYQVELLHVGRKPSASADVSAPNLEAAREMIRRRRPVIVAPNYLWQLYLEGLEPDVYCLGMCHADDDEQYYRPLTWYEPMVAQFIAVSRECAERLSARLAYRADDVSTLPYGIPVPERLVRTYQTAPLRIIYAGRVTQLQKRVWDFVPFVEELLKRKVDFTFDVVGDGDQLRPLQAEMERRFSAQRVRFLGRLPHEAMRDQWLSHEVFVQTSDFEGTSISMLEAMAHGVTPVVTRASSGVVDVIRDQENGLTVPVGDMSNLAAAVAMLAGSQGRLMTMGAAAHATAQAYSMEKYLGRFVGVLDRIMEMDRKVDVVKRYGMFGGDHPVFCQQQVIARQLALLRSSGGDDSRKLGARLLRTLGIRSARAG